MKVTIKKITAKTNNPAKAQAKPVTEKPTMPAMSETMCAEMQKMMGKMMKKDIMDTAMYLMNNAVVEDGKLYTPVTHTYIGWYDGSSMMGWCDSNGYRKLIEEVGQLKAECPDEYDDDIELQIEIPDGYEIVDDEELPF